LSGPLRIPELISRDRSESSKRQILRNQFPHSSVYVAGPEFPTVRFCRSRSQKRTAHVVSLVITSMIGNACAIGETRAWGSASFCLLRGITRSSLIVRHRYCVKRSSYEAVELPRAHDPFAKRVRCECASNSIERHRAGPFGCSHSRGGRKNIARQSRRHRREIGQHRKLFF